MPIPAETGTTPAQNAAIDRAVNKVFDETHAPIVSTNHRASGPHRRFAGLLLFASAVAAACGVGGDKTPTTSTTLPTNTPDATVPGSVSPSPLETLGDTATATAPATPSQAEPSATATETLASGEVDVTFASIIADLEAGGSALDKYTPVTDATLRTDYQPFVNDSDVQASRIVKNTTLLEECLKSPGPGADNQQIQQGNCTSELVYALRLVAKLPGNSHVKLFASDMARLVTKSPLFKDPQAKATLVGTLKTWAAA